MLSALINPRVQISGMSPSLGCLAETGSHSPGRAEGNGLAGESRQARSSLALWMRGGPASLYKARAITSHPAYLTYPPLYARVRAYQDCPGARA